jgi:hypothetical protein
MTSNAVQLIGVYDADGTVWGEVSYWVGARFGVRHCSLCDITHGTFREKSEWRECREELGIEFLTFHRDDQPDDVREHLNGQYPAVVMRREDGRIEGFMNADDIEACHASPDTFAAEIRRRLAQ